jgi:hypothetical protein
MLVKIKASYILESLNKNNSSYPIGIRSSSFNISPLLIISN